MTEPSSGGALPVRRSYPVDTGRIAGLVIEIDPTQNESALAVLQAQLHEQPDGMRIIFGYDLLKQQLFPLAQCNQSHFRQLSYYSDSFQLELDLVNLT